MKPSANNFYFDKSGDLAQRKGFQTDSNYHRSSMVTLQNRQTMNTPPLKVGMQTVTKQLPHQESMSTFSPWSSLDTTPSVPTNSIHGTNTSSRLDVLNPHEVNKLIKQQQNKKKSYGNYRRIIQAGIGCVVLAIIVGVTMWVVNLNALKTETESNGSGEREENFPADDSSEDTNPEESEEGITEICNAKHIEESRMAIAANLQLSSDSTTVLISNLKLSCFPRSPFLNTSLDISAAKGLSLENVEIVFFENDALPVYLDKLSFTATTIGYFGSQSTALTSLELKSNTLIGIYPQHLPADEILMYQMGSLNITQEFVNFLVSAKRKRIEFEQSLTDDQLQNFQISLSNSEKKLEMEGNEAVVSFRNNSIMKVPSHLFTSGNFEIAGEIVFNFVDESSLQIFHEASFNLTDTVADRIELTMRSTPNLTQFPEAFAHANPNSIALIGNNITTFSTIDFALFTRLEFIFLDESLFATECATDQDKFRLDNGVPDEVDLYCD
eukprot:snap_masked-scaffold_27-processed-gene-2.20-mRNA-1 protein AED:1.00 eAED:1.00 QI:0/-1/0/0/-1/1/1/0/496